MILAIIIIVAGYFILRQIRITQAKKNVNETVANLQNTLSSGISNSGNN